MVQMQACCFERIHKRLVQNFLDIVILRELRKGQIVSGYDVIGIVYKKYGILLSSGTAYAYLYALEREGLIQGEFNSRKRTYRLTEHGASAIKSILEDKEKISKLLLTFFSL